MRELQKKPQLLAIEIAWQIRRCPPADMLMEFKEDTSLQTHLGGCLFCRECREALGDLGAPLSAPAQAGQLFGEVIDVRPGQIWRLSQALSGWGPKNRYYNPPLVLILEILQYPPTPAPRRAASVTPGAVRVAQVYDDLCLSGPGDFALGGSLFAESWNTYTMRQSDLGILFDTIPMEIAGKVSLAGSAEPLPDIDPHSILAAFRRLEIEVAAFFATQALSDLFNALEPDVFAKVANLCSDRATLLSSFPRSIRWPQHDLSTLEMLALAEPPAAELPLAASEEVETLPVNLLMLRGEGAELTRTVASLTVWRRQREGFLVGGQVHGELLPDAAIFCRWVVDDSLVEPSEAMIDAESGYFRIFFAGLSEQQAKRGRLTILVGTQ